MKRFLTILLMTVAFAMNVSVVNAKDSTGQGGTGKEFLMAMMADGDPINITSGQKSGKWGPNSEYTYTLNLHDWEDVLQFTVGYIDYLVYVAYTTDGTEPSISNVIEGGQYAITPSTFPITIKAHAIKYDNNNKTSYTDLGIFSWTITKNSSYNYSCTYNTGGGTTPTGPAMPKLNLSYDNNAPINKITLQSTPADGTTVRYNIDSSNDPDESSVEFPSGGISIDPTTYSGYSSLSSITVKAKAFDSSSSSGTETANYSKSTITPSISYNANNGNQVSITATNANSIYYKYEDKDGNGDWGYCNENNYNRYDSDTNSPSPFGKKVYAIAQENGKLLSNPVVLEPTPSPTLSFSNNTITASCTAGTIKMSKINSEGTPDIPGINSNSWQEDITLTASNPTVTVSIVAYSNDHMPSEVVTQTFTYQGGEKPKSAKPFIKYLEDNTADPVRKVIYADGHYTAYTNRKYTTGETLPSKTSTEVALDNTFDGYVIASNPSNGTKYNLIATEGDSYSYSDPVSFTYNSNNIPVISCENNTVTISNPGDFYTIYYTKNQADNNFHYADDSSTPYEGAFPIDENSIVCIYAVPNNNEDYVVEVKQNCEYTAPASKPAAPTISISHGMEKEYCTPATDDIDGNTINSLNNYIYISTETNDAKIYYTTDNSDPRDNTNANRHEPTDGKFIFDINQTGYDAKTSLTVKAAAFKDNVYSDVKTETFNKSDTPSISRSDNTVTITADGYTWLAYKPNASSQWIRRIQIPKTISNYTDGTQISAVAATSGCLLSNPATYPTSQQTSAPSITCINNVVTITNDNADSGATIYYTIDGTTTPTYDNSGNPGTNTYKYTDQFTIQSTCTVQAIAVASGKTASEVASLHCAYQAPPTITHNQADNTVYIYGGPQVAVYYSTDNGQSWNNQYLSVTLDIPENGSLTVQAYSETSQSGHTITSNIVSGGPYNYVAPASDIWVPTSSGAKTGTFTWIQKETSNDHVINLNFGDAIKNGNALYFNCSAITDNSTWKVEFEYGSGQWTSIANVQYSSGGHNVYYDEWLRNNSIQKSSLTGNVRIRVDSPTAGTMTISDAGIIQYPTVNTTQKCVETGYTDCYLTTFTPFDFLDATDFDYRGGNYNYLTGNFSRANGDSKNSYFEIPVSGLKVKNIKRLVLNYSDPNQTINGIILVLRDSNGNNIVDPWTSDWTNTNTNNTTGETDISRIRVVLISNYADSKKPLNFTINNLKMYLTGVGTLPTSGDWDYGTWTHYNDNEEKLQVSSGSVPDFYYTISGTRYENEPTTSSTHCTSYHATVPLSNLSDGTHYVQILAYNQGPSGVYTWKVTKNGNSYTYEYLGKNEKALVVELDDNFELIDGEPDYDDHFLISGEPGSVVHYTFKYAETDLSGNPTGGYKTIDGGTVNGQGTISNNLTDEPVVFNSSRPLILEVYATKDGKTSATNTYTFVQSAKATPKEDENSVSFEAKDGDVTVSGNNLKYYYYCFDYTQNTFVWSNVMTDITFKIENYTAATSPISITTISKESGKLKVCVPQLNLHNFVKPDAPTITNNDGTVTISTDEEGTTDYPVYLIYTTDGTDPSYTVNNEVPVATSGTNTVVVNGYTTSFTISETTTVKAYVYCKDTRKYEVPYASNLATETYSYTTLTRPDAPTITSDKSTRKATITTDVTSTNTDVYIFYTTDGTEPTTTKDLSGNTVSAGTTKSFTRNNDVNSVTFDASNISTIKAMVYCEDEEQFEWYYSKTSQLLLRPEAPKITYDDTDENSTSVTISTHLVGTDNNPVYLIYTTNGTEPVLGQDYTVENGVPTAIDTNNTSVGDPNVTVITKYIEESKTYNALVYWENKEYKFYSYSPITTQYCPVWRDWELYGRGAWEYKESSDVYVYNAEHTTDIEIATDVSDPKHKRIKIDGMIDAIRNSGDYNILNTEEGKYKDFIFEWDMTNGDCFSEYQYTGLTEKGDENKFVMAVCIKQNSPTGYIPIVDSYLPSFNLKDSSSKTEYIEASTKTAKRFTLKMDGLWLGDMVEYGQDTKEDETDDYAIQNSYMPRNSHYKIGLVKIPDPTNYNHTYWSFDEDGKCYINSDINIKRFFDDSANSESFVNAVWDGNSYTTIIERHWDDSENAKGEDTNQPFVENGKNDTYKMLDQFKITEEGAYYIVAARLVPNGEANNETYSYSGAYRYMPVYYSPSSNWKTLSYDGMRTYRDDLAYCYSWYELEEVYNKEIEEAPVYSVEVQEKKDNPGLFRVKNMYHSGFLGVDDSEFTSYQGESSYRDGVYFYIDATQKYKDGNTIAELFPSEFYAQPLGVDLLNGEYMMTSLDGGKYANGQIVFEDEGYIFEYDNTKDNYAMYGASYVVKDEKLRAYPYPIFTVNCDYNDDPEYGLYDDRFKLQISTPYPLYDDTPYTTEAMNARCPEEYSGNYEEYNRVYGTLESPKEDFREKYYTQGITEGQTRVDVTYERNITNYYGTIMMPFDFNSQDLVLMAPSEEDEEDVLVPQDGIFELYEFDRQEGQKLVFTKAEDAKANTPIVFKFNGNIPENAKLTIDIKDTEVKGVSAENYGTLGVVLGNDGTDNWQTIGAYTPLGVEISGTKGPVNANGIDWYVTNYGLDKSYAFTGNEIKKSTQFVRTKQYRAFFYNNSTNTQSLAKSYAVFYDDAPFTSITDPTSGNEQRRGAEGRYNVAGQKVKNGYRGVVIENGKKRFVK